MSLAQLSRAFRLLALHRQAKAAGDHDTAADAQAAASRCLADYHAAPHLTEEPAQ